jgi:hypothetical protein
MAPIRLVNVTWDRGCGSYCECGGRAGCQPRPEVENTPPLEAGLDGKLFPPVGMTNSPTSGQMAPATTSKLETVQFHYRLSRRFRRTAFGWPYDMAGIVWEWTHVKRVYNRPHWRCPVPAGGRYELAAQSKAADATTLMSATCAGRNVRRLILAQGRHNLYVGFRCRFDEATPSPT